MQTTLERPILYRGLGRIDVVALTLNNIIGAGIFALPAALVAAAGEMSLVVLLFAFLLVSLMALCTVEVASRYDVTGGPIHYASVAFGEHAGFAVGWLMYLSRLAAFGAIASVMLEYAAGLWPLLADSFVRIVAITLFVGGLVVLNLRGVVQGALVSNLFMLAKGIPLVALALVGLWLGGWADMPTGGTKELADLNSALLIAFFACMGFEQVAVVAGEARNAVRDIPIGIIVGLAIVGVLYALLMFASFATVPNLAESARPLADAATALIGPAGAAIMSVTAVFSCAGGLSASLLVSPRALFALAVQGHMPRPLTHIEPKHLTPATAIVVTGVAVWLLTISGTFVYLVTFSVLARMTIYASTCAALIRLRTTEGPPPMRIPFGPVMAVLAILICIGIVATASGEAVRDLSIAVAAGWLVRMAVRRWQT